MLAQLDTLTTNVLFNNVTRECKRLHTSIPRKSNQIITCKTSLTPILMNESVRCVDKGGGRRYLVNWAGQWSCHYTRVSGVLPNKRIQSFWHNNTQQQQDKTPLSCTKPRHSPLRPVRQYAKEPAAIRKLQWRLVNWKVGKSSLR